jgi:hypothetical protein
MMFPYRQPVPGSDSATVGVFRVLQMPVVVEAVGDTAAVVAVAAADKPAMVAQVDRQAVEEQQMATAAGRPAAHHIASRSIPAVLVDPAAVVAVVLRFPRYSLYRYIFTCKTFYTASWLRLCMALYERLLQLRVSSIP